MWDTVGASSHDGAKSSSEPRDDGSRMSYWTGRVDSLLVSFENFARNEDFVMEFHGVLAVTVYTGHHKRIFSLGSVDVMQRLCTASGCFCTLVCSSHLGLLRDLARFFNLFTDCLLALRS